MYKPLPSTKLSNSSIDLSIIIPAYHEADRIGQSLETLAKYLEKHDLGEVEVLVVAADSPDQTAEVAEKSAKLFKRFQVVRPGPKVGKGRDVGSGMKAATGRYKLFMDADLATPLHHLDDVKTFMDRGGQVGIAVRTITLTHTGLRKLISEAGNLLTKILIAPNISDTQCGFKVFESGVSDELFGRQLIMGWAFDMELLFLARKLGYEIETFTADDWHDPKPEGLAGESAAKAALSSFKDLLRIRLNAWRGLYHLKISS